MRGSESCPVWHKEDQEELTAKVSLSKDGHMGGHVTEERLGM